MRAASALIAVVLCIVAFAAKASAPFVFQTTAYTSTDTWSRASWTVGTQALDLTGYTLVWSDEFNTCDIGNETGGSVGHHSWYARNDTYGYAKLVQPTAPVSPFACNGGVLTITLSNPTGSQWQGGLLAGENKALEGRDQLYGYWEARVMLPAPPIGLVPWPAFWFQSLYVVPAASTFLEVDAVEPGQQADLTAQATSIHEWPGSPPNSGEIAAHRYKSCKTNYTTFDGAWHTYGLKWTPSWFIAYVDSNEICRFPNLGREARQPIYPLLDVAISQDPSGASPSATYSMSVDYVRAYTCAGPTCN